MDQLYYKRDQEVIVEIRECFDEVKSLLHQFSHNLQEAMNISVDASYNQQLQGIELPKFNGDKVLHWIYNCEIIFHKNPMQEQHKFQLIEASLQDRASIWHQTLDMKSTRHALTSWNSYMESIYWRFGVGGLDPIKELKRMKLQLPHEEYTKYLELQVLSIKEEVKYILTYDANESQMHASENTENSEMLVSSNAIVFFTTTELQSLEITLAVDEFSKAGDNLVDSLNFSAQTNEEAVKNDTTSLMPGNHVEMGMKYIQMDMSAMDPKASKDRPSIIEALQIYPWNYQGNAYIEKLAENKSQQSARSHKYEKAPQDQSHIFEENNSSNFHDDINEVSALFLAQNEMAYAKDPGILLQSYVIKSGEVCNIMIKINEEFYILANDEGNTNHPEWVLKSLYEIKGINISGMTQQSGFFHKFFKENFTLGFMLSSKPFTSMLSIEVETGNSSLLEEETEIFSDLRYFWDWKKRGL